MKSSLSIIILSLISVFGCIESKSQNGKNDISSKENFLVKTDCEIGKKEAEIDINNNDLGFYFYGLQNPKFNTWVRLMREEYGLKVKGGGDIIDEEGECYNQVMREKIKEKFGKDAFERIENKLDSLYELGLGDREPEFVGGQSELMKYIYCNIEDKLLVEKKDIPIIVIQIIIVKDGMVINKGIVYKNKFAKENDKYKAKAIELIEQMPSWMPAIENLKAVDSGIYSIPIKFEKEMKNKICG